MATKFQTALRGKNPLLSVKTLGTTRIHRDVFDKFVVAEKLCAMDNLRLWRDDSSGGRVFAVIQCSAQFRIGYLAFHTNGAYYTVYVSDCGPRRVKAEGLTSPVNSRSTLTLHEQSPEDSKAT